MSEAPLTVDDAIGLVMERSSKIRGACRVCGRKRVGCYYAAGTILLHAHVRHVRGPRVICVGSHGVRVGSRPLDIV